MRKQRRKKGKRADPIDNAPPLQLLLETMFRACAAAVGWLYRRLRAPDPKTKHVQVIPQTKPLTRATSRQAAFIPSATPTPTS